MGIQPFMIGGNSNYFLSASTDRLVKIWKFGSGARMNEIKLVLIIKVFFFFTN